MNIKISTYISDVIKLNLSKRWKNEILCLYVAFASVLVLPSLLANNQMDDLQIFQKIFRSIFYIRPTAKALFVPPNDFDDFQNDFIKDRIKRIMDKHTLYVSELINAEDAAV